MAAARELITTSPNRMPAPKPRYTVRRAIPNGHPKVAHFSPYRFNDSIAGIEHAHDKGYKYIDQDAHVVGGQVVVIKHWTRPSQDGFGWMWTGEHDTHGHEVRVKDPRPHVSIKDRTWREVSRLRTSKSRTDSGRYLTAQTHMKRCAALGLTMCMEVKEDKKFEDPELFYNLSIQAHRVGCHVIIMTLQNLGNPWKRLEAAHPYFPTALLPRAAKPPRWDLVGPNVDVVWGSFK